MSDRRESGAVRTDRPAAPDAGLPTLAEALEMPALVQGMPEVLVGRAALDARVRWVHVSDSPGVARLLDGGELLLTTASAWPEHPEDLRALVAAFAAAGLVGIVIELGAHYRYVPAVVLDAARATGLVLIALHREVKFVAVTEQVHRRIIDEQTTALRARDEVRTLFTELALRGAPADYVVQRLARTLRAPVILESLAHEVIVADLADAEHTVLDDWQERSRLSGRDPAADRTVVPVQARGTRWGALVALAGPAHPAGRLGVLEQGATALALGRLADTDGEDWEHLGRRRLVDALLAGRYGSLPEAAVRLTAAGLLAEGVTLRGLAVSGAGAAEIETAANEVGGRALCGTPRRADEPAEGWMPILLATPSTMSFAGATVDRFLAGLRIGDARVRLVVGPRVDPGAPEAVLTRTLDSAREALDLAESGEVGEAGVMWVRRHPLLRFVAALRGDHRLLAHAESMLAPVLDLPPARRDDLLDALAAVVAHPGNRTAAATAAHVSRSVFYQRLDALEEVLGVRLDDGEVLAALHLALAVHRAHAGAARRASPTPLPST
ncbi:PucR family transcriptional regulator [Microbacterium testaceum]|uniref:PucR family transcriptional regulator n=1 Tax=Microbacterium testaceum TaxID=2033 RepID=UPI001E46D818|nr:PucR family transcriptional regulator [Microbacterium testaceum]